jgi:hypothetical protein
VVSLSACATARRPAGVLHVHGAEGVHARSGRPEDARSDRSPEFIAAIDNADDFCIDQDAGFAYVTRHRGNTLDRVPLAPRHGSEVRHIAGEPVRPARQSSDGKDSYVRGQWLLSDIPRRRGLGGALQVP